MEVAILEDYVTRVTGSYASNDLVRSQIHSGSIRPENSFYAHETDDIGNLGEFNSSASGNYSGANLGSLTAIMLIAASAIGGGVRSGAITYHGFPMINEVSLSEEIQEPILFELTEVGIEQVDDARAYLNITVTQLSDILGITRQAYYNWRKGAYPAKGDHQQKIGNLVSFHRKLQEQGVNKVPAYFWNQKFGNISALAYLRDSLLDEVNLNFLIAQTKKYFDLQKRKLAANTSDFNDKIESKGWEKLPEDLIMQNARRA